MGRSTMTDAFDWDAEGILWRHPGEVTTGAVWSERIAQGPLSKLVQRAAVEGDDIWRFTILLDADVNQVLGGEAIRSLTQRPDYPGRH